MSTNIANQVPFLRTSRSFPIDLQALNVEINRSYVDIAEKVNDRIIGVFPLNVSAVTGESWFLNTGRRQQTLRQVYAFTSAGNIPHGINFASVSSISPKTCGVFTDGTNWYGCMFASNITIGGQVTFYVTPTNIVIQSGAGAPTIVSGLIDLEWISQI